MYNLIILYHTLIHHTVEPRYNVILYTGILYTTQWDVYPKLLECKVDYTLQITERHVYCFHTTTCGLGDNVITRSY